MTTVFPLPRRFLTDLASVAWLSVLLAAPAAAATLKVGLSVPLAGVQAGAGTEAEKVWRAFAKQVNDKRLLGNHTLEILVADDGFEVERAKANAESLTKQGVLVMTGTPGIPTVQAMLPILEKKRVPMLGPASGSLALHGKSNAVFHVKASFGTEVDRMADLLATMGLKKVAVITDDAGDRKALIERFSARLKQQSGGPANMVVSTVIAQKDGKTADAVAQVLAAKPDAVYVMTIPGLAGGALKAVRGGGHRGFLAAWSVASVDSVISALGSDGAGIIFGTVMPSPTSELPGVRAGFRAFAKAQGITPSYRAMEIYITGRVLVEALSRVPGAQPSGADLWAALENLGEVSIDGWRIGYSPAKREGSRFVDTMMLGQDGRFR